MTKLTLKHYLIIFVLFVSASSLSALIFKTLLVQSNDNSQVVMFNLKALDAKISGIEAIVKSYASEVKLKDRLDPSLVAEFGADNTFLKKIAILKKQIVKRRLEGEVIKLENEKVARDNTSNDADIYDSPYKKNIASKVFEVMMINSSSGVAVVRINDNVINVKKGDNIKNFIVRKINSDSIVMGTKDGDDEVLGLNYLSSTLYEEKKDGKDVK